MQVCAGVIQQLCRREVFAVQGAATTGLERPGLSRNVKERAWCSWDSSTNIIQETTAVMDEQEGCASKNWGTLRDGF